jgi:predicted metal-dependent hydrolase
MELPPVEIEDRKIPVQIIATRNRHAYARVRDGSLIISLPSSMREDSANRIAMGLYNRMKKAIEKKPERYLYNRSEDIKFRDGQTISILGREFNFRISYAGTRARTSVNGNSVVIRLPESLDAIQKEKAVSYLAIRAISRNVMADVESMVNGINSRHFRSRIGNVRLMNASTRWGSCSLRRNRDPRIMLNSRLLFMPEQCLEYVIVHELAHTKVPKHTDQFWAIVSGIMPDYKERIKLLRENAYKVKDGPI